MGSTNETSLLFWDFTSSRGAESRYDRHHSETRVGHGAAALVRKAAGLFANAAAF